MKLDLRPAAVACLALTLGATSVAVGVVSSAADPRSGSGSDGASAPTSRAGSCAEVGIVAVDATGDGWSGLASAGPTLRVLVGAAESQVKDDGSTVQTYHLGRPFAAVATLAGDDEDKAATAAVTKERVKAYREGVSAATTTVVQKLESLAAACPQQTFVLAGMVQGAAVVHRVVLKSQTMSSLDGRLAAAALVSDPSRVAGTASELLGAPVAPASGSGAFTQRLDGIADVPTSDQDLRVVTVCTSGDLVCDLRGWSVAKSMKAFTSYLGTDGRARLEAAAARLTERVSAWPRVVPGQTYAVRPDVSFSGPLDVRVGSAYAGTTVFTAVGTLPAGVSLSRAGVLSGKVTKTGTWTIDYTVRGTDPRTTVVQGRATLSSTEPVTEGARTLAGGGQTTCYIDDGGAAYCVGDNASGQLGIGSTSDRSSPVRVGTATDWSTIDTSGATTCGIRQKGSLYCWGMNNRGQLGIGNNGQKWSPTRVGNASDWAQVSTSWLHTCGVRTGGALYCWGENNRGQLGTGSHTNRLSPIRVGTASNWESVTAGGWHTCAVRTDGSAWCWGLNDLGQLGTGGYASVLRPAAVAPDREWASLDTTWSSTCGLTRAGYAMCWGLNDQGQVGDGSRDTRLRPTKVAGDRTWTSVALGDAFACGLDDAGKALCWGENTYGQLGTGTKQDSVTPVRVAGGRSWTDLDAGWLHACGTTVGGSMQCWGNNEAGQLARGDRTDRSTPPGVRVTPPARVAPKAPSARTVVTSFNVLGSQHTRPGGGARNYAPGRIRSEWTVNQLRALDSGIVAFQEIQVDQYLDLKRAIGNRYDFYPANTRHPKVVWQSVMWDESQWQFKEAVDVWVPVIGTTRPNPLVRLRNIATGKDVWVFNVHNSSRNTPQRQRERNRAVRIEINHILDRRNAGVPVIFLGDMNERATVFCKVTGQTDLESVTGGSNNGTCRPPRFMHLDWMFTSPEFDVHGAGFIRNAYVARITDHSILSSRMTAP